jgi:hypothetical protein
MGLMRFIYVRSMALRSISKFLLSSRLVFESLLFIVDKMGDLSLQEPEPREVVGSDVDRFPPMPVRVSLACEAQLEHGHSDVVESESGPSGDYVDHHENSCPKAAYPIYKSSSGSDSDDDRLHDGAGRTPQLNCSGDCQGS